MTVSMTKPFAALALTLTIIAGTTAAAQAGGGKSNGAARASGVTLAYSQPGPVVRDHRGQSGSQSSGSGWNGQVRDHRTGHQFCFGGLFGGTHCTQL